MITTEIRQQAEEALTISINRRRDSLNQNIKILEPIHIKNQKTGQSLARARCILQINGKPVEMFFHPERNRWERI